MTQKFKSIEEIKEEVAKEYRWDGWDSDLCEETIRAYTQQYIDANKELYKEQLEEYASFQVLIKSMEDRIKELQQSNKELVEMLERAKWEFEQFKDTFGQGSLLINEISQLLLKHDKS